MPYDYLQGTKSLFKSKTFWGVVLMVAGFIFTKVTGNNPLADPEVNEHVMTTLMDIVDYLFVIGGMLISIYGRVTAKKKVTITGR